MQDPLDIATYTDLDLSEFRVSWTPRLLTAFQERAAEEIELAPILEQQRLEQIRRREERTEQNLRDFQRAAREFRETQREVDEWLESRRQAQLENNEPPL